MTTFKYYSDGHTNIKFSPGLVLGWLTRDNTTQTETRFALYADGRILQAEPVPFYGPGSDDFAPKGRKWSAVATIPDHAEFIGNYESPALGR